MEILEPKRKNPLTIRLGNSRNYVVKGNIDDPTPVSLNTKVDIDDYCYGMTIYTADGSRQYYQTQSRIKSLEIKANYLVIYEEGKSLPWRINKKGIALNRARFDAKNEEDVKYVEEEYGLSKNEIPALNDYEAYLEYVLEIEPRTSQPIVIDMNDEKYSADCYFDENGNFKRPIEYLDSKIIIGGEESPLINGAVFAGNHYGFKVVSARKTETYPTQCPIYGIELRDGIIQVFEHGKFLPWKINGNLDVVDYAKFLDVSKKDVRYLESTFGLSIDDVENVNSYGLKYVNK